MQKNKTIKYDAIIIGGGIAGASVAYMLKKESLDILVLEKNKIASGDSQAAGAFLSPKISKPSPYKEYLNRAFSFTTNFYKENFSNLFNQCSLLKLPLDEDDALRLKSYEPYIDIRYSKQKEGYLLLDAGIIEPKALIEQMLNGIEVLEDYRVDKITYKDDLWRVDNFCAKYLIIAVGSAKMPIDLPYIGTKRVGGYRYDISFNGMQKIKHNIHKDISISAYHNGRVIVGAPHIRSGTNLEDAASNDSYLLLQKAQKILPFETPRVIRYYTGYRLATFDYFPIIGEVVDHKATLEKYPYISKGSKVPSPKYIYYPNLYIHTALGSRGFVFAPYNGMILSKKILKNEQIDERLSTVRLFKKWARRL